MDYSYAINSTNIEHSNTTTSSTSSILPNGLDSQNLHSGMNISYGDLASCNQVTPVGYRYGAASVGRTFNSVPSHHHHHPYGSPAPATIHPNIGRSLLSSDRSPHDNIRRSSLFSACVNLSEFLKVLYF